MIIFPRLPYDVINFEIDLMKDLGVKIEHGRWSSQLFDFFLFGRVVCWLQVWSWSCQPGEADHKFKCLFIFLFNCNIFNPDTLGKATSLLSRWKRTLEQVFILLNMFFFMQKIVRHQEDKAVAIVYFLGRPKYTFHIQFVHLSNDQKSCPYPDHVDDDNWFCWVLHIWSLIAAIMMLQRLLLLYLPFDLTIW